MTVAKLLRGLLLRVLVAVGFYNSRAQGYVGLIKEIISRYSLPYYWLVDIGAGNGCISSELAVALDVDVIALDINRNIIRKRDMRASTFLVADAQSLPIRSNSIGACVCISLLEHLPDPEAAVKEMTRVSNNLCVVQIPNIQWFFEPHTKWPFLWLMPSKLQEIVKKATSYTDLSMVVTLGRVIKMFKKVGWRVIKVRRLYYGLEPARLLPWSPGYLLVLTSPHQRMQTPLDRVAGSSQPISMGG